MITGATKGKVDAIWQKMWEGGITNPLEVISQLTYLMFIRSLDDKRDADADHDDIPDILAHWADLDGEEGRTRSEKSFLVPRDEIAANDYDFSFNKYMETVYERVEYPPATEILADLDSLNRQMAMSLAKLQKMLEAGSR